MIESFKSEYLEGQLWSVKDSQQNDYKFALIIKLETLNNTKIVHISVLDASGVETIGHMPFSEKAFSKSINKLVQLHSIKHEINSGYQIWREEFDTNGAGVYNISIMEAVNL